MLKVRYPISIFGSVNQVFHDELSANLTIEQIEDCGSEIQLPDQYDVPLIELFPTIAQENNALNVERTAECIDSLRFFYLHIWRSWDTESEEIEWKKFLECRVKFYFDLISKKMSKRLTAHINNLLEEANYCWKRKELIEEEMDESDVRTNNVKELMHLHFRLKMIINDLELLENEDMRQVFESMKFHATTETGCGSTKRFSLNFHEKSNTTKGTTFIICPEQTFGQLTKFINQLKIDDKTLVSAHYSLAEIFERCSDVKQIYLTPGRHNLNFNENLFGTCSITGSSDQTSVLTSKEFGTTLLTLNGNFVFENVSFNCKNSSNGLIITEGETTFKNCNLTGNGASATQEAIIIMGKDLFLMRLNYHCQRDFTCLLKSFLFENLIAHYTFCDS